MSVAPMQMIKHADDPGEDNVNAFWRVWVLTVCVRLTSLMNAAEPEG